MHRFKIVYSILYFLSLCIHTKAEQTPIDKLSNKTYVEYYSDTIFAFEDKSKLLTINDIKEKGESLFKSIPNYYFGKYINSTIWFKCKIIPSNDSNKWYFSDFAERSEKYSIYYPNNNGEYVEQHIGAFYPFRNNENEFPKSIYFPFYSKDTITFYVRCESRTLLYAGFNLKSSESLLKQNISENWVLGILSGCLIVLAFYNFFIFIILRDRSYLYYTGYLLTTLLFILTWLGKAYEFLWPTYPWWHIRSMYVILALSFFFSVKFSENFLLVKVNLPKYRSYFLLTELAMLGIAIMVMIYPYSQLVLSLNQVVALIGGSLVITAAIHSVIKKQKIAVYFLLAWLPLIIAMFTHIIMDVLGFQPTIIIMGTYYPIIIFGSTIEAVFLSLALAYRINLIRKELEAEKAEKRRLENQQQIEKTKFLEEQKMELEIQVTNRTAELNFSLIKLKETQKQLVAREKLASLGQLTAGIAHEIQNPLNFVNNFSELSTDLINELSELKKDEAVTEVVDELKENVERITFHGKRAEKIVRSMLLHSRDEQHEIFKKCDLNEIIEQAVIFSYNSYQSIQTNFHCNIVQNLKSNLPEIELIEQSISRVIINLINNAFDAINDRSDFETNNANNLYIPEVRIQTIALEDVIQILIWDNGLGISEEIKEKVFDPFFTTKSAGKGTGLGLSISFDLIVGRHNGEMEVESEQGAYTQFSIKLPLIQINK